MKTKVLLLTMGIGLTISLTSCGIWEFGCPPCYELPSYAVPPPPPPRYHRPAPPPERRHKAPPPQKRPPEKNHNGRNFGHRY